MEKITILFIVLVLLTGCKSSKKGLSQEDQMTANALAEGGGYPTNALIA